MDIGSLIKDPMKDKVKQNETVVVSYDSFQFIEPFLINEIIMKDDTTVNFFNINKLKSMSPEQRIPYVFKRKHKNIFKSLLKSDNTNIDCDKLLKGMINNNKDIYKYSPINTVFKDLRYMLLEKSIMKIIFIIEDDENYKRKKARIVHQYSLYDRKLVSKIKIVKTMPNDKEYFIKLCKQLNFTNLFIDDIEIAKEIYNTFKDLKNKNILLPVTGYNIDYVEGETNLKYKLDFDPLDKKCIIAPYQPLEFTQEQLNEG